MYQLAFCLLVTLSGATALADEGTPHLGAGVLAGTLLPSGEPYLSERAAFGVVLSGWTEMFRAVAQPRLTVHWGPTNSRGEDYLDVAADMGALWMFGDGAVAPLVGGSVGLKYVRTRGGGETFAFGNVIETRSRYRPTNSDLGATASVRGGVLFMHGAPVQLLACADYGFSDFGNDNRPQYVAISVGFIL